MSEHSVQTADDNGKVISEELKLTLVLNTFILVLYFKWITISNLIRYLPIKGEFSAETVWLLQGCFAD